MARLPQLISALAAVDGRRLGTIEHGSRVLREEGLLVTGKRGVGAPEMDFADAANLLIAVNAAETLVDAPEATRLMRSLEPAGGVNEDQLYPLPDIERAENFGEALGWVIMAAPHILRLIDGFIDLRYGPPYTDENRAQLRNQIRLGMGPVVFKVELARTFARLAMETVDSAPGVEWERRYYMPFGAAIPQALRGDRRVTVDVGLPTVIALHECISGNSIQSDDRSDGEDE